MTLGTWHGTPGRDVWTGSTGTCSGLESAAAGGLESAAACMSEPRMAACMGEPRTAACIGEQRLAA